MIFFKRLFSTKPKWESPSGTLESRFIAVSDLAMNSTLNFERILQVHGVRPSSIDFFRKMQCVFELKVSNGMVYSIVEHSGDESRIERVNIDLPVQDWIDRDAFFLVKDSHGRHRVGGKKPDNYVLPSHPSLKTPFIYLASLDMTDSIFEWMNLSEFHISFPINECNEGVFIDMSEVENPVVINPETFSDAWYDPIGGSSDIISFREQRYSVETSLDAVSYEESPKDFLFGGIPFWFQFPDIPVCPKTGEVMHFVCMINSDETINVTGGQVVFGNYLIFGDHGNLYVFYHPVSRVVYLLQQF